VLHRRVPANVREVVRDVARRSRPAAQEIEDAPPKWRSQRAPDEILGPSIHM
jgi:hypothetical protein